MLVDAGVDAERAESTLLDEVFQELEFPALRGKGADDGNSFHVSSSFVVQIFVTVRAKPAKYPKTRRTNSLRPAVSTNKFSCFRRVLQCILFLCSCV